MSCHAEPLRQSIWNIKYAVIFKFIQKFCHISHFEPDFTGEKSKLYILQQCIIYLKYLFLDTLPYDMKEGSV